MGSVNNEKPLVDMSVAIAPNDIEAVPSLLKEINEAVPTLGKGGDEARHVLLLKARALVQALETPRETMIKHSWAQPFATTSISVGVEAGLWKQMVKNGDRPQKVTELASQLNVSESLLRRTMRHLGAMGYITETGENEYKSTNYSKSLSNPLMGNSYLVVLATFVHGMAKFFEFARKHNFQEPTSSKDTSLMYAYQTDKDLFAYCQELGYGPHFNHHMGAYRQGRPPWMDASFYPVKERLIDGAVADDPEAPFLVDIGGSVGHDLVQFHNFHPTAPGKLVLQDLPVVIGQITDPLPEAVKPVNYDFLEEQPVKGARAYYMHSVLHDWPDDVCEKILARIKAAMKPGYSRLLINENVIPHTEAYWETTALDGVMLTLFSSRERSEPDWRRLVEEKAGLKIVKIYSTGRGVESIIEVELA